MKQISKATKTGEETLPEHYVLLCARRYASTVKKFALAVTDDERQQHRKSLRYILDSGLIEAKLERERRLRRYPHDFRKALVEKDGSIIFARRYVGRSRNFAICVIDPSHRFD